MKILVCKHDPREGLGYFERLFLESQVNYEYQEFYHDPEPRDLKGYDGLVIMGGPMNAYEENRYPFLKTDLRYIEEALKLELPQLGFCLGAQLLARALGGKVFKNLVPELGWYSLSLEGNLRPNSLLSGFPDQFWAFEWHEDTFEIPPGCVRLASSALCANQGFSFHDKLFGLQFHLEVDGYMIRDWLTTSDTPAEWEFKIEPVLQDTASHLFEGIELGKRLFQNFLKKLG